tara:strand:+ start:1424 stop:1906 length:483 start_codon:yes stop_codon:yes gene_type:complete
MATLTSLLLPAHGSSQRGRSPYMIQKTIDLTAQAIDCSSGDIVQCLTLPANTRILHAGVQVVLSATQNTGTDATVTLGTAVDDNEWVAAFDIDGAADGAYAPSATPAGDIVLATADTLDLTFAGSGATFTAGTLRVYAVLMDISDQGDAGPTEVDRDALA